MQKRNLYLQRIIPFIDKPFIKVITGLRRSGKSALLELIKEEILTKGINEHNIIYLNFESFSNSVYTDVLSLYNYIKTKRVNNEKYYLFFDEIQEVNEWEKAVNSFLVDFNVDIYITGSNSHLLSSELATYITGRYVEFQIQTLNFNEYLEFSEVIYPEKHPNLKESFNSYLRLGGFPVIHTGTYSTESAYKIVYDIYSSAVLRDTIQRFQIRNVELLERVILFVFDNIGNSFSAKNIADYFKSQLRKVDINTIYNYLNALESAFIINRVQRYDIKGKELLKTQEKYFLGDVSLMYALMGYRDRYIGGILENIVLLDLKSKGYKVFVGKFGTKEIDFIAEKGNEKIYIQVCYLLTEQTTIDREFGVLKEIRDQYPKYVISMDPIWQDNIDGIKHYHIADFLRKTAF
jgi:predicted AAA+ superfamily ATPase